MPSLLNWAIISLSLINTILLLWLGLTVKLNAERRSWGVSLISGGLLLGGLFFVSHTAILGYGLTSLDQSINFWWQLGLVAALILPFVWYIVILWYSGFWEDRQSTLYRRHLAAFALDVFITFTSLVLLLFANPFPSFSQVIALQLSQTLSVAGVPAIVIVYMISTLLSIMLSVDVLMRPGPVRRIMGDIARQRAKPWLVATSLMLLLVGLLIAGVMIWIVIRGNRLVELGEVSPMETGVAWFDMVTSGSITLAVLFLGQAIVRYEVFTGKTLPQRRFMRHWRNVVALAISCGVVMSAALLGSVHPVYILLVMAILVTVSYALFSRNSYAERERYINHLRPFIVSQRLYDHLLAANSPADLDLNLPFQALCRDVLGTRIAYLAGVGSLGPLMGTPAVYPEQMPVPILPLAELCRQFRSTQIICIPVDPATCGEAHWAVPLWSERGLIGILLLGEKWNGGLYTQEEIEIARASGERMIDTKASTELAQRLMTLQRQRLTESQVVDRRTRRTLHDEILPKLHATMLALNGDKSTASQDSVHMLANLHGEIANLLHAMPDGLALDLGSTSLVGALKQLLDGELSHEFEEVTWQVDLAAEGEIRKLPLLTLEVLYFAAREAIRNAARHGRGAQEDRSLKLTLTICCQSKLEIVVEDNGVGLDRAPGGKTSGNGLALHSTMMAIAGGLLAVENLAGHGTRVVLSLTHA